MRASNRPNPPMIFSLRGQPHGASILERMRFLRAAAAAACGAAAYSFVEPYRRRLQVKEVLVGPGRPPSRCCTLPTST